MERKKVGEVFHYYGKIGVAAIRLSDGSVAIGDTVQIMGPTTNLEQRVDTLQIEHADVTSAHPGQEVGMKVRERVREHDFVYKLVETLELAPAPAAPQQAAVPPPVAQPKAPRKKVRRTAKPKKKRAPRAKTASRAKRSKARRRSRGSQRRSR